MEEDEDFPLQMIWNLWGTYMRQDVVHQGLEAFGCLYDNLRTITVMTDEQSHNAGSNEI
jgi:hypothetical protein